MSYAHYSSRCGEFHHLVRDFRGDRPAIVCLCGSTRFVEEFNRQRKELTEAGQIVLSIEVVTTQSRADDPQHADPGLKARLDELHKRKLDLCDYAFILNVGGYIGESTRSEIEYAEKIGRPVRYLVHDGCPNTQGDVMCPWCRIAELGQDVARVRGYAEQLAKSDDPTHADHGRALLGVLEGGAE